jgi:soluble lytic murein transglycosylase-like protein
LDSIVIASLLLAICEVESSGKTNAINIQDGDSASLGYCQVKFSTAKWLGYKGTISELWLNKEVNKRYAKKYIEYQYRRYQGDIEKTISAYNAGTATDKNEQYVRKVLKEFVYE